MSTCLLVYLSTFTLPKHVSKRIRRLWVRTLLGKGDRVVDLGLHLPFDLGQVRIVSQTGSLKLCGQARDGVARGPLRFLFFAAVGAGIAALMADPGLEVQYPIPDSTQEVTLRPANLWQYLACAGPIDTPTISSASSWPSQDSRVLFTLTIFPSISVDREPHGARS